MATGTVKSLWRFPVTPLAGERLRSTRLDERGLAGDRRHLLFGPQGPLTAEDAPALSEWRAEFPFNPDGAIVGRLPPYPILHAPGATGSFRWGDPRLRRRLERAAGVPLEFVRDSDAPQPVVVAATAPDVHGALAGVNVQLDLELPPGGWAGRELRFADGVRLRLVSSRADGPGIETRVIVAGRIVIGESVELG
jgi:MOSC N-terminal beta barrel domain